MTNIKHNSIIRYCTEISKFSIKNAIETIASSS